MANEIIRPSALETERTSPVASEFLITDNGTTVAKVQLDKAVQAGRPAASKSEAETGTDANKVMTPLTVQQKLDYEIGRSLASKAQGDKADTAVQPSDLGAVATSNDYDDLDNKPTLGTAAAEDVGAFATATQGGKADTAWQPTTVLPSPSLGDWDGATAYLVNDRVFHNGNYWIAKADNTNSEPEEGADWTLFLPGVSVADGSVTEPKYATGSVSERALADETLRLINGPKRPKVEKWLVTSDWQAQPDQPGQIAKQRAMMDDIQQYHPDCDFALFAGDLVERPTDHDTGTPPGYGFSELLDDIRTRIPSIPLSRWFFIPGNHERDGTGVGQWKYASSLKSYRDNIGPEFYCTRKGNLLTIYMGDMSGSVSGEILDYVVEWFARLVRSHQQYNIIVVMHQPLVGVTVAGGGDDNSPWVQHFSQRIIDVLNSTTNIACVFHGHCDGDTGTWADRAKVLYGTTHVNLEMHIPAARPARYGLMTLTAGQKAFQIRRWDADAHAYIEEAGATVDLNFKFDLDLGGDFHEFDGRHMMDPFVPVTRGPSVSYVSAADLRSDTAPFAVEAKMHWVDHIIVGDDSNDSIPFNIGVGQAFYVPGQITTTDSEGFNQTGIPGYGFGGGHGFARNVQADQEDYQSHWELYLRTRKSSGHTIDKMVEVWGKDNPTSGLNVLNGGSIRVGTEVNHNHGTVAGPAGVVLRNLGNITASRASTVGSWQRLESDGELHTFFRDTTYVGGIRVESVGRTKYYFTSDCWISGGPGSPEGSVSAPVGCEWNDTTNGVKYMKKTGTGNTGWKLVTQAT